MKHNFELLLKEYRQEESDLSQDPHQGPVRHITQDQLRHTLGKVQRSSKEAENEVEETVIQDLDLQIDT